MGRGLVRGTALLSGCSLLLGVVANSPLWLVQRSEAGEELCWHGEGVWQSNVWFGTQPRILGECNKHQAVNAKWLYCGSPNSATEFEFGMCQAVQTAQPALVVTMVLLILLTGVTGWFQHRFNMTKHVLLGCIFANLLTVLLPAYVFYTMQTSPLFSDQHRSELSAKHPGIPFGKWAGCSLTSPLHSIKHLLLPATLECLFPGPAYFATGLIVLLQALGLVFLLGFYPELTGGGDCRPSSMYGALVHRTKHFRLQFVWIAVLPFVCIVSHGLVWLGFVFYGVQIINTVEFVLETPNEGIGLFKNTLNGFNFSPELSVSYFWNNGAPAIASLCLFAMLIAPIGKSLLWIIFFYAPSPSKLRGAVLLFLDLTGKVQLVYVFVLTMQAVCSTIHSKLYLLHFGDNAPGLAMEFVVGFTWNGWGAQLLLVSIVWSLILGQLFVELHNKCLVWEAEATAEEEEVQDQYVKVVEKEKTLIYALLLLGAFAWMVWAQCLVVMTVKQTDALTLVIPKSERTKHVSVIGIANLVMGTGVNGQQPWAAAALLVIALTMLPLLRIAIAGVMCLLPLSNTKQRIGICLLQLTAPWSSLEIFLLTIVCSASEITPLTEAFSGGMTPNLNQLVRLFLPWFQGMLGVQVTVHWFACGMCALAVAMEKLMVMWAIKQARKEIECN